MKFTTVMAVFAAALCVAGCKYNKINEGDVTNNGAMGSDIEGLNGGNDSGTLSGITEGTVIITELKVNANEPAEAEQQTTESSPFAPGPPRRNKK